MPAKNIRLNLIKKWRQEDNLRRKQSRRETRKLISTRNYWDKEANKNFGERYHPKIIQREGDLFTEYFFPNTGETTVEKFLRKNKFRIFESLKPDVKVNYNLKIKLVRFSESGEEKKEVFLHRNFFVISSKKDYSRSFKGLIQYFNARIAEWKDKGTGWQLEEIVGLVVKLTKFIPMKGGCAEMEMHDFFKNRKIFPLIKSPGDECFKYAISYFLANGERGEISEKVEKMKQSLNWNKVDSPAFENDLAQFERNNPDYLVYCYFLDGKNLSIYYKNKNFHHLQKERKIINLFLYNFHYYPIMNESVFHSHIFSRRLNFVCKSCLNNFSKQDDLDDHYHFCQQEYKAKIKYPGGTLKFKNFRKTLKVPYICILDTESNLVPMEESEVQKNTTRYQKHEVSYFGLTFIDTIKDKYEYNYFTSAKDLMNKLKFYSQNYLMQPPVEMPKKEIEKANIKKATATHCNNCNKEFSKKNYKCRHHCHFSGKFISILCNGCNLKAQKSHFIPVIAHNMMIYDMKHIIREFAYQGHVEVIPKSMENYLAVDIKKYKLKFIDSLKFMGSPLGKLVNFLRSKGENNFKITKHFFPKHTELFLKKGHFPYDYVTSDKILDETCLPPRIKWKNKLTGTLISEEDYQHCLLVWKVFGCKTLRDYLLLYLKSDCCLLGDIMIQFSDLIYDMYGLDSFHYISLPSLSQDAALKYTNSEIEIISDPTIYNFIESGIRGGISMVTKRYVKANNKYMRNYNPKLPDSFLILLDKNNLYGGPMLDSLPVRNFKFLPDSKIPNYPWRDEDCMLCVDISLPKKLRNYFRDYPLFPEHKNGKLYCTLKDKKYYVVTSRYLKFGVDKGYKIDKIHKILTFQSEPWLKPYIEKNTEMRAKAESDFEKELWKLKNNSMYGKQIENKRNRIRVEFANKFNVNEELKKQTFKNILKVEDLFIVEHSPKTVKLNSPIQGGMVILDFSKLIMAEFWYDYLIPKYGNKVSLVYTDTDSFLFQVFTEDFYKDIRDDVDEHFDTSNFPKDFKCLDGSYFPVGRNKKVVGKMKDEMGGKEIIVEFVGLRSKLYSYKTDSGKETYKCKGITKQAMQSINFDSYLQCLFEDKKFWGKMNTIRSHDQVLYSETVRKKILDAEDEKRLILDDNISTVPWGYY